MDFQDVEDASFLSLSFRRKTQTDASEVQQHQGLWDCHYLPLY